MTASNRMPVAAVAVVAAILIAVVAFQYLGRPPQMGPNPAVMTTVDALYTAVRNRDAGRMDACERKLHDQRAAGALPDAAADYLDGVLATARGGEWETAAEQLYKFILAQRREGEPPGKPAKT